MGWKNSLRRYLSALFVSIFLLTSVSLWVAGTFGSKIAFASGKPAQATLQPTEAPVSLATLTPVPAFTPVALPSANWDDVSVYRKAMKPAFVGDVDHWVNGNRYLIVASLDLEGDAVIRGGERVRYTNHTKQPLSEIVFRLYPNTPALAGHMDVLHVTNDGAAAKPTFSQLNSVMTVPLSQPLAVGKSVELTVDFDVVMTREFDASYGRFGFEHKVVSGTAWYPTFSVYDEGLGWWKSMPSPQGDPAYTETGLYDVRLTTPADFTVAMSGKEIETTTNAESTVTHRNVTGPMRDFAFMASSRYAITSADVDGTRINVVHYKDPANPATDGTQSAVKYASQALSTYDKTYGEYPFAEFDVVENPTPTGVEFPGLIQVAERSWVQDNSYLEIVIAHEVGHQWFYSMVGNNQVEHPWLDESLTSYTEFVYMRAWHTQAQADGYVADFEHRYARYTGAGQPDLPLDLPVEQYSNYGYGIIVYTKGPLFLVELERQFGRDMVYKMLSNYFHSYQYAVATSTDVEKSFEKTSSKDLSALFQKWVGVSLKEPAPVAVPSEIPTAS